MKFAEHAQLRAHHKVGNVEGANVRETPVLNLERADDLSGCGDLP